MEKNNYFPLRFLSSCPLDILSWTFLLHSLWTLNSIFFYTSTSPTIFCDFSHLSMWITHSRTAPLLTYLPISSDFCLLSHLRCPLLPGLSGPLSSHHIIWIILLPNHSPLFFQTSCSTTLLPSVPWYPWDFRSTNLSTPPACQPLSSFTSVFTPLRFHGPQFK